MLQNKIYYNYFKEILKIFITILLSLTIIAWTVRAVNFLDLIVENGYSITTYFNFSLLNSFGIATKFVPLSFLLTLTIFIIRLMQENELVILWTSGVKKIKIINLFLFISIVITIINLILSIFITPTTLNKSRHLLSSENLSSILPTLKIQQFSDSFKGLTFIVDDKLNNKIKNIFLYDTSENLRNLISSDKKNLSTTIIAKNGIVEKKKMTLFDGQIISSNKNENDIIKFEQISIDLTNLTNTTIKKPKIQETSTIKLLSCINKEVLKDNICNSNFNVEILPTLTRRIILPLFIPVLALITSLLLIKSSNRFLFNKISIFSYAFLVLLYAELTIRYTGVSKVFANIFIISPFLLLAIIYIFIKYKLSKESNLDA